MKTKIKASAVPATEYRTERGAERLVGANGEINGSSKRDVLQQANILMSASAAGDILGNDSPDLKKQRAEAVRAAFNDEQQHKLLGEKLAEAIYMTGNRKGYMRRVLAFQELVQGQIPRFPVRAKNVTAVIATGPTQVQTQLVDDRWLMPPEWQIVARPFISENELNQSNDDVLNEKYIEALEAIMVQEDRTWRNMARMTIGVANVQQVVSGTLTPTALAQNIQQVTGWGIKIGCVICASDLMTDIIGDSSFVTALDPVARHELVLTGQIATLFGAAIISEQYRHPEHKVLQKGEYISVGDPLFHGGYTDRGGVKSEPTNGVTERVIGRGWLIQESVSMQVANERSVAFGRRL